MNQGIRKKIKENEKISEEIKKIESQLFRRITDKISIGYRIESNMCFLHIGQINSPHKFKAYFHPEKISYFIEQLQQMQKSIDNL